jgi:type IV pilus assembly protein PilM
MSLVGEIENARETVLHCPRCETTSLPNRRFCAKCGSPLWEPCLRCGEPCAAGESFCGACGACLPDVAAEEVERLEGEFRRAAELESSLRFDEAIALLTPIGKKSHPRVAEYAARARGLVERLADEHRRQRHATTEAYERAHQCLAASDFDGAAKWIDGIPLPLQDEDLRQLRAKIAEQQREIEVLAEQLRNAVHQNRLLELPTQIEQLLALKPDHAYVRSVAPQLQTRLVGVARKMLTEHRYDEALALLDRLFSWSDGSNFQRLYQQASELAWLDRDLRSAPVIDDTLVAVSERLRRMAPGNARAVRLHGELQRRIQAAGTKRGLEPLAWARPPEQTALGVPVEWLTGFQRVAIAEAMDRAELSRHPGRFAVACGLALGGIKQAALRIDLSSVQQKGLLRRVKHLMQPQTGQTAWGIDVGGSSLKAVKLVWNKAKQQAGMEAAKLVEYTKPLSCALNEADETAVLSHALQTFLDAQPIGSERVCVGLPGRMTLSRQIEAPAVDAAKASKLVQFEAVHQFPFPLPQLVWDYQILDQPAGARCLSKEASEKRSRVLLVAAKRVSTQRFLEAFERCDVRIDLLQPDSLALHNFLVYEGLVGRDEAGLGEATPAVAALDIGCDAANIVVSSPESVWFHGCGVAGHGFTRALVRQFNLTLAQAEQRKRAPESAERFSDLYECLSPVFDDLLKEVQQSLTAFAGAEPRCRVQRVLGLGGGFLLHGLLSRLRLGR